MTNARLNHIFRELRYSPSAHLCCMSTDRWSWAGAASHDSLSLTDQEITELFTGGMLARVSTPSYGWGTTYQYNPGYCPPAFLADTTPHPAWMDDQSIRLWRQR